MGVFEFKRKNAVRYVAIDLCPTFRAAARARSASKWLHRR
jgi:hypothetical protein